MKLSEDDEYNAVFPARRIARVVINTKNGDRFESAATEARGDPEAHLSDDEIREKFQYFTEPKIGSSRSIEIVKSIDHLGEGDQLEKLLKLIVDPI